MKNLIFLLALVVVSCSTSREDNEFGIIVSKNKGHLWNNTECLCEYTYYNYDLRYEYTFMDSCSSYSIGQTLFKVP